jgi:hypothetical protein
VSHSVEDERTVKIRYHKYVYIAKSEVEMKTHPEGDTTAEKERAIIRSRRVRHLRDQVPEVSHNGTTLEFHG